MATGFVHHELYLWHDTGSAASWIPSGGVIQPEPHAESPETKRRLRNLLEISGLLDKLVAIEPREATVDEVARLHSRDYIERIRALSAENGGDAGEGAPFGRGSYEIALLAAGGVIAAVDAVLDGRVSNAYALVRPPGHHAEAERGRGFCIFGNAAIAAHHALRVRGISRIATVDWDVHHGNGTQAAFYDRADVLTISIHQDNNYPVGSGAIDETGDGAGKGYTINLPLPAGSGHGAYIAAVEQVVAPALRAFRPELIILPMGFDANIHDPLGRQMATSRTFREMTAIVKGVAAELCAGRIVVCHEGGYSSACVPFCGLAVIEELSGQTSRVEDPFLSASEAMGGQALQPHQAAVIEQCAELAAG